MYLSPYSWKSWSKRSILDDDETELLEEQSVSRSLSFPSNNGQQQTTDNAKMSSARPHAPIDEEEPMHVDAAEKIYDSVKGVWGWGKGVFIFSPFLGLAEAVAGKVVETAGSSLGGIDSGLTGKLQELDDGILNPAIHMVVKTFMGAAHKTEGFVKPIILTVLKPLDFLIKHEPEKSNNNDNEPSPDAAAPPKVKN
ncbi:hypothetical protein ACA910_013274 [Epithemia clementina (nom. ined.)]